MRHRKAVKYLVLKNGLYIYMVSARYEQLFIIK